MSPLHRPGAAYANSPRLIDKYTRVHTDRRQMRRMPALRAHHAYVTGALYRVHRIIFSLLDNRVAESLVRQEVQARALWLGLLRYAHARPRPLTRFYLRPRNPPVPIPLSGIHAVFIETFEHVKTYNVLDRPLRSVTLSS